MAENALHLTGNLTRTPELRFANNGSAICKFGVAVNSRKKNPTTGEYEDGDAAFFDCTAFGTLAENIAECLDRGHRVTLNGRMNYDSWESDDGSKRSRVDVIVDSCGPDLRWATATVVKNERS